MFAIIGLLLFVVAYIAVIFEHKLQIHKSAVFMSLAGVMWILVAISGLPAHVLEQELIHSGNDIFGIVVFLLSAMTLVEILIHYRFFDVVRAWISKIGLKDRAQFGFICAMTFLLSSALDNLTVTIVMIQIARQFFGPKNLLRVVAGIIIMSNAGGAWSPIGDVTTLILWLGQKFSVAEILSQTFLPAVVLAGVTGLLMAWKITANEEPKTDSEPTALSTGEWAIVVMCLVSFVLPLGLNFLNLPPYMGRLIGLGIVWILIELVKRKTDVRSHLEIDMDELLKKSDLASLQFFIGILLSVAALKTLGALEILSTVLYGSAPSFARMAMGNIFLGGFSAVLDNVPLTALAMNLIHSTDPRIWTLLALCVGTGGSFLIIGSVSGVVAMGMVKELTFGKYLKIATLPAVIGYIAGIVVWWLQNMVLFSAG